MGKIDYDKNSQVLRVISHPIRLQILEVLLDNQYCVNELSNALKLKQAISSHHLGIMRNYGIVHLNKQGSRAFYVVKNDLAKGVISILQSNK
jgi:DNA-binding transcriptional ArsR family regulator